MEAEERWKIMGKARELLSRAVDNEMFDGGVWYIIWMWTPPPNMQCPPRIHLHVNGVVFPGLPRSSTSVC